MSVPNSTSRVSYTLTTTTQTLSVPFYFLATTDLQVIKQGTTPVTLAITTNYTVTGAGVEAGGSITLTGVGVSVSDVITIKRNMSLTQPIDLVLNDRFPSPTVERMSDRSTMQIQQLSEVDSRALRFEEGEILDGKLLLSARKGNLLGFHATTGDLEYTDAQGIIDDATAQAVIATTQAGIATDEAEAAAASAAAASAFQASVKVGTIAELSALVDSLYSTGVVANVRGALIDGDDLGGLWRLDLTDSSTTVDGRTVVASQSGKRWKRVRDYSAFGDDQLIQGREYMTAFQAKLLTQATASIVMSGDSTTAGDSTTTPYRVWEIIPNLAAKLGFPNVTATNAGHSGGGSATWLSTWLATDLALNPDCYIVRWGLNDPTNQSDYLNAQVIINNLRTGLAAIRAAKSIAQMSVIVMMPNSCTDDPAYRTAAWFRELRQGFQKAARDYQCAFFDTYTLLRDSSFGQWINEDYSPGSGRYVHPLNIGNVIICGELSDLLFPRGFNLTAQGAGIPNSAFPSGNKIGSDALSAYPLGLSIYPCLTTGSGTVFQYQGYVITFKQASSYGFQINIFADNAPAGHAGGVGVWAIRHGFANTGGGGTTGWSNWWNAARGDTTFIGDTTLSFSNSWANFGSGMRNLSYNRSVDGIVQVSGLVAGGTFTPYGATTVIATLPAGCRPVKTAWFLVPCAANATDGSQLYATVLVTPAGDIQVYKATGNYYLALDQVSFSINT